ncbi:multicopper oxidase domain-containing protein [Candidatus Palauibacter sp.]|uniref:multicopper oxidase domain-containing protein n=1 Tax=Candidatus Palauibacter sp. TaxID=3101350 RepID=UPI003B5926AF
MRGHVRVQVRLSALVAGVVAWLATAGGVVGQLPGSTGSCEARAAETRGAGEGGPPTGRPATDLHCISLFSTARAGDAQGLVELGRVPSPFGVTVTPTGHHVRELTAHIEGLPPPSSLGPYTVYMAWATPLELAPVVPLGPVANGEHGLGRVAFNKFLVMVSAEASADVTTREGPLVLRGRSPSALMEAHDLLALAPSATRRAADRAPSRWNAPPTYPGIAMLPGVMDLEPPARPASLRSAADLPPWESLPEAAERQLVDLPDGGTLDLEATIVRREIEGRRLAMLAFNGQHPGPLIRVPERSTIFINFTNRTPYPTAVHWHGIRLDNEFDGVPGLTQDPVEPGESFQYRVFFRDVGIYWYHPHHREDVQQELGLYGNLLVDPAAADYYGPANREEVLILDDILLDEDGLVDFGEESANYMLMGRFGNRALVNGEPVYALRVDRGEVVRFHLTNASNTRTFNLSFVDIERGGIPDPDQRVADPDVEDPHRLPMKVVASDVGRFEREAWTRSVVLAPAERYVIDVRFDRPGRHALVNHVQGINHRQGVFRAELRTLGGVTVASQAAAHDHGAAFETLREHADVIADIDRYRPRFNDEPDHELVMTLETVDLPLPIERSMAYDWVYFNPVEWTGTMPRMNWATTGREIRWILREGGTGRENEEIEWNFAVGDVVKIRVVNDRGAFHAMQHPLHIHGQRFLVLSQNGVPNPNLVWKDTALLPAASTTDILLELSNPGRWMIHCHIAEHLESGMKMVMNVVGAPP